MALAPAMLPLLDAWGSIKTGRRHRSCGREKRYSQKNMITIAPIDYGQRQQVVAATREYISRAGEIYGYWLEMIPVQFDLKGRAAGMYRVRQRRTEIRYNPYLFAKYFGDNLAVTVPHEVAHYVTDRLYGLRSVRPHGAEWQSVMRTFGAPAAATSRYDLTGIPVRTQRRHPYHCGCTAHQLTSRRHNQISRGTMRYFCRGCGGELILHKTGHGGKTAPR